MKEFKTEYKIVNRDAAAVWVRNLQAQGEKVVFTNGVFDLLHIGHKRYLEQARSLGDALVVAVNADVSARRLQKGPGRPIHSENKRAELLAALGCVDRVVLFSEDTPLELIETLKPDVLVKGGDYAEKDVVGRDVVPEVRIMPLTEGTSTSAIIEIIKELNEED